MKINYGPDSNLITDSRGQMVSLSDAEIAELTESLTKNAQEPEEDYQCITDMTNEQYVARELKRQIRRIAKDLRTVADRVEDRVIRVDSVPRPGVSSYASIVESLMSDLRGGNANLMVEQLVAAAYDADYARITAVTELSGNSRMS